MYMCGNSKKLSGNTGVKDKVGGGLGLHDGCWEEFEKKQIRDVNMLVSARVWKHLGLFRLVGNKTFFLSLLVRLDSSIDRFRVQPPPL